MLLISLHHHSPFFSFSLSIQQYQSDSINHLSHLFDAPAYVFQRSYRHWGQLELVCQPPHTLNDFGQDLWAYFQEKNVIKLSIN